MFTLTDLGLTLTEIREVLASGNAANSLGGVLRLLARQIAELDQRIDELIQLRNELKALQARVVDLPVDAGGPPFTAHAAGPGWLDRLVTEWALLCHSREHRLDMSAGTVEAAEFTWVTGWRVEHRGLCRGDVCIPADREQVYRSGRVDLATVARVLHRPFVTEPAANVAVLGDAAFDLSTALASRQAPEFALPDLDGTVHRLGDYRGRKVLLAAFASW